MFGSCGVRDQQQQSLQKAKELLTSDTVMAYFDNQKETEVITDASPWGLSAILTQHTAGQSDHKIVVFVSRSLSDVEQRYSRTEKEALAIVWAVERLHLYLYGGHFKLLTDFKPIELILNNPKSKPPARIARWNLRLQEYDFTAVHLKGADNPSDFLSRHPSQIKSSREEKIATSYVNFISSHAVPKAMTLSEIETATKEDATLQKLVELVHNNNWEHYFSHIEEPTSVDVAELKRLAKIKEDVTVNDDGSIILRGTKIILPTKLRQRAIRIALEGHQGIVKTKQLLREKVWFPQLDKEVKQLVGDCIACQANGPEQRPDPLQMSPLPPEPWHTVHVDFCGPFPTGDYLLVAIDAYSRFPEVDVVRSTSAKSTINKLARIFATHGFPTVVRSDNGPPFTSYEFKCFMEECGIQHQRMTPLWPQANSEAKRFMKPLTKAVRSAHTNGQDWKKELHMFLLNYRATPHTTTGESPANLLFNRQIRTKLPQPRSDVKSDKDVTVREKDSKAKTKMKENADRRRGAQQSEIKVGDMVLKRKDNKFSTRFDANPFCVTRVKGTMITVIRNGKYVTRNVSLLKKVNCQNGLSGPDQDDGDMDTSDEEPEDETEPPGRRYPTRDRHPVDQYGQNVYDH